MQTAGTLTCFLPCSITDICPRCFCQLLVFYSAVWTDHSLFILSFPGGHFGYYRQNSDNVQTSLRVDVGFHFRQGNMPGSGMAGGCGMQVQLVRNDQTPSQHVQCLTWPPALQEIHLLPRRDTQDSHVCSANVILRGKQPLTHDRTMGVSLMTEDAMSGHVLVRGLRPLVVSKFPPF